MTREFIEKRKGEILEILKAGECDIEALETEDRTLDAEMLEVEKREAIIKNIEQNKIDPTEKKEERTMNEVYNTASPEYRSAYFKKLGGFELDEVEQRAFIATTANFGGALPVTTLNEIWSNIEEEHPILGDIAMYRTGTVLEASVHTAIAAGDAAVTAQGVAATDEENTFVKVTLSGKDFSKHVEVSYALGRMSAPALEEYLKQEIAERLGAALAADVIAQIVADTAAGNKVTSAAVKVTTYTELNGLFALIKAKGLVVYANSTSIYKYLTSIVDTTGRPIYQPSMQAGVEGFLIGAPVKAEDACTANLFYIGAPKKIKGNMVQDIMVESDRDIKRHVDIHAGYARFECKLTKDTAFVVFTVKQA